MFLSFSFSSEFDTKDGDEDALNIYRGWEIKCRHFMKFFFGFVGSQSSLFLIELLRAIIDICMGNSDTSAWNLLFNLYFPFETESIFGWLLYWLFQWTTAVSYVLSVVLTTTQFMCFCYYISAICDHFDLLIGLYHSNSERIQNGNDSQSYQRMWQNSMEKLQHAVEIHVRIYE